jgi:hypothetical protein
MNVNFFQVQCQDTTTNTLFGICDNQNGSPAFIDATNQSIWIAKVINSSAISVTLIAVDNCITILRNDGSMDMRCDAILAYPDNIIFLELKNQLKHWITDAVEQLETTIINFRDSHDISIFRHKKAFAANKKHPQFSYGNNERRQRFFSEYRVRLNIEATIKIQ